MVKNDIQYIFVYYRGRTDATTNWVIITNEYYYNYIYLDIIINYCYIFGIRGKILIIKHLYFD